MMSPASIKRIMARQTLATAVALALVLCACGSSAESQPRKSAAAIRKPPATATWHYQLQGSVPLGTANVLDIDGFDTPASFVSQLRTARRYPVCYIDAGTWEDWRPDAARFPSSVLGNSNGWPGERWLDIRRLDVLAPIMRARMRICRSKRFLAVEPDNVDGYSNNSGFPLTAKHQLIFNRWLARTAHKLGLAVALKNDLEQASVLASRFDFAVVEQCFEYDECDLVRPFTRRGRAVFEVEYSMPRSQFCDRARGLGISGLEADTELNGPTQPC
jgi:hypothetical protein